MMRLAWFKSLRALNRYTQSDWLIVTLASSLWAFVAVNATLWASDSRSLNLAPSTFPKFIVLILCTGFAHNWLRQIFKPKTSRPVSPSNSIVRSSIFALGWLGLPAAIFYGVTTLPGSKLDFNFTSGVAVVLLAFAFAASGALLANLKVKGFAKIILGLAIILLILGSKMPLKIIEQVLVNPDPTSSVLAVLLGLGLLGTLGALTEILRPHLATDVPPRYIALLTRRDFPSFTGLGGIFLSGLLLLARDKIFLALVIFSLAVELLAPNDLMTGWRLWLVVWLPILFISLGTQEILDCYRERFSSNYRHLPLPAGVAKLSLFFAGLATVGVFAVITLLNTSVLNQTVSLQLLAAILASYAATTEISRPAGADSYRFSWVWRLIYRSIAFATVFSLSNIMPGSILLALIIALKILIITSLPFRTPEKLATI